MQSLKKLSIRCSGLITEAKLLNNISQEEIADLMGIKDRTLRERSNGIDMFNISMGKIAILADLAGYEVEFTPKRRATA